MRMNNVKANSFLTINKDTVGGFKVAFFVLSYLEYGVLDQTLVSLKAKLCRINRLAFVIRE